MAGVDIPGPLVGPQVQYPTPWRVAEQVANHHIVVCAEGHYVAEVPDRNLAHLIVQQMNSYGAALADDCPQPLFPPRPTPRRSVDTQEATL